VALYFDKRKLPVSDASVEQLRVDMTACSTDKELRVTTLETWRKQQNGDLRRIRTKTTAILISVIMLLIGVVMNLVVSRTQPDIRAVVEQVLESIDRP